MEGDDGIIELPGSDRNIIWIPKRQSLKHAIFSLPEQLSGRKLASALELKVQAWAPFASPSFAVLRRGNKASVIAWDKNEIEERILQSGYQPAQCEIIPEAFMREPASDGIRLIEVSDGLEAQVWNDGFLTMTRWWSKPPSQEEWSLFTRGIGASTGSAATTYPAPAQAKWLEFPWNSTLGNKNLFNQIIQNQSIVTMAAVVLFAPCLYFTTEWLTFSFLNSHMNTEISQLEGESQSARNDRRRAIDALEYSESLINLRAYPRQIEIISRAHSLLRPFDIQVSGWDYDEGILEFGLKSDASMDATLYIPAFENDPMFSQVSASTRGQRLVMRMNVTANEALAL